MAAIEPVLKAWRLKTPGELVFPTSANTMMLPADRVFQEAFHAVLAAAELPKIRFHDLRHSYASGLVARGVDLYRVQSWLGHASPQMTMRYSHLSKDKFSEFRDVFGTEAPTGEPAVMVTLENATRPQGAQNESDA
jgi:site-specific recombinase XerD